MDKDIWEETNFYGVVDELEDSFSDTEKKDIKKRWIDKFGDKLSDTIFKDEDFFTNFINSIPFEEQEQYIENTINYAYNEDYDPNYVIVVRRAVPSYESKPENFWAVNSNEPLNGLSNEIRNEQRLHSVIMVSTLEKLTEHGIVSTNRGTTDGEIAIDPNKSFSDFLFMYKPQLEFYQLVDYLEKGGIKREKLLEQLKETALERAIRQGLPVKEKNNDAISLEDIEESTQNQTVSEINAEVQYLKQREKDWSLEQDEWEMGEDW